VDKYLWVKDLVLAEQEMEEKGLVDFTMGPDLDKSLEVQTIEFLRQLKTSFVAAADTYNSFKKGREDHLKIYGVSRTLADFMLFRNSFKLIFSMNAPGTIQIYSSHLPSSFIPTANNDDENAQSIRHVIKARWGALNDLQWTFKSDIVQIDKIVKYYFSNFIKMSS